MMTEHANTRFFCMCVYECASAAFWQAIRKLGYDASSGTSIVECTPVHGRTHQIRLHLQVGGRPFCFASTNG